MIGDVNLFLHTESLSDDDDEADNSAPSGSPRPSKRTAELEIMLPSSSSSTASLYRPRTGLAFETLQLFLLYASKNLDLKPEQFIAKVGFDNEPSLKLFEKLGFVERKRVEVFREIELGWKGEEKFGWEEEVELGRVEDPRDPERD